MAIYHVTYRSLFQCNLKNNITYGTTITLGLMSSGIAASTRFINYIYICLFISIIGIVRKLGKVTLTSTGVGTYSEM